MSTGVFIFPLAFTWTKRWHCPVHVGMPCSDTGAGTGVGTVAWTGLGDCSGAKVHSGRRRLGERGHPCSPPRCCSSSNSSLDIVISMPSSAHVRRSRGIMKKIPGDHWWLPVWWTMPNRLCTSLLDGSRRWDASVLTCRERLTGPYIVYHIPHVDVMRKSPLRHEHRGVQNAHFLGGAGTAFPVHCTAMFLWQSTIYNITNGGESNLQSDLHAPVKNDTTLPCFHLSRCQGVDF